MSKSKLQTLLLRTPHNGWCFLRGGRQTNRNKAAWAELTPRALFSKYLTCTHTRAHAHPSLFLCELADFPVWAYNNKVAIKWQLWVHSSVYLIGLTCFSGGKENTLQFLKRHLFLLLKLVEAFFISRLAILKSWTITSKVKKVYSVVIVSCNQTLNGYSCISLVSNQSGCALTEAWNKIFPYTSFTQLNRDLITKLVWWD